MTAIKAVLTADTITDEQIRAGYQAGLISYDLLEFATFPAWNDAMTRPYYRGRCAEILNASDQRNAAAAANAGDIS